MASPRETLPDKLAGLKRQSVHDGSSCVKPSSEDSGKHPKPLVEGGKADPPGARSKLECRGTHLCKSTGSHPGTSSRTNSSLCEQPGRLATGNHLRPGEVSLGTGRAPNALRQRYRRLARQCRSAYRQPATFAGKGLALSCLLHFDFRRT